MTLFLFSKLTLRLYIQFQLCPKPAPIPAFSALAPQQLPGVKIHLQDCSPAPVNDLREGLLMDIAQVDDPFPSDSTARPSVYQNGRLVAAHGRSPCRHPPVPTSSATGTHNPWFR